MKKLISRRHFLAALGVAAAAGALSGCSGQSATTNANGEHVFELTLSHGLAEDHAVHIALSSFADAVREQSEGTIDIQIFPNATLGSEVDNITQIRAGALDMAKVSASTLGNFQQEWNVLSVPYVFNDQQHYYNVMDGQIAQDLYQLTADKGFMGLTWMDSGARSFYTANKAIRTPADLKGLMIRTMDSQMAIDMMTALGGSATVTSYSESYTALQQGVIDGVDMETTMGVLMKFFEVAPHYTKTDHVIQGNGFLISNAVWNKLSPEQQEIIQNATNEMEDWTEQKYPEIAEEYTQIALEDYNLQIHELTEEERQAFVDASQSVYEKHRDKIGGEYYDWFMEFLAARKEA